MAARVASSAGGSWRSPRLMVGIVPGEFLQQRGAGSRIGGDLLHQLFDIGLLGSDES